MTGQGNMVPSGLGGGITLKAPSDEMDGVYQCYARNQFGSAVSSKALVKKAGMVQEPATAAVVP